ncbi:MAG: hypothetical protein S0880_03145 [Actinomycetota bacterium]|nr:hypothetical protein [Actinomycetota bacterium]
MSPFDQRHLVATAVLLAVLVIAAAATVSVERVGERAAVEPDVDHTTDTTDTTDTTAATAIPGPTAPGPPDSPAGPDLARTDRRAGLDVVAPSAIDAGRRVTVEVHGPVPGEEVRLVVVGSLGTSTFSAVAPDDAALAFSLAPALTRAAGEMLLVARTDAAVAATTVAIRPGPVADPVEAMVGPRSIVAAGGEPTMVVAIPTDALGNATGDATPVDLVVRRPGGEVARDRLVVEALVAWELVVAGTTAGRTELRVGAAGATGPVAAIAEVAGRPEPFAVTARGRIPAADGHRLVDLRTSVLADGFGNVVPDGTLVVLDGTGPGGRTRAQATTLGGVARFTIRAPSTPGAVELVAYCQGTRSAEPLVVEFDALTAGFPLDASRRGDTVTVSVGPVRDDIGAYVADGTEVAITLVPSAGDAVERSVALEGGAATVGVTLDLPSGTAAGPVTVIAEVLGLRSEQVLP